MAKVDAERLVRDEVQRNGVAREGVDREHVEVLRRLALEREARVAQRQLDGGVGVLEVAELVPGDVDDARVDVVEAIDVALGAVHRDGAGAEADHADLDRVLAGVHELDHAADAGVRRIVARRFALQVVAQVLLAVHAFVKPGRDTINRGAHQGDGHDADDHTESSQHGACLVRRHLRGGDLPALSQFIEKAFHAANVPQCALAIEDIFQRAGALNGVFQTLLSGPERVAALIADRRVAAVTLTGSDRAGSEVAGAAGRAIKKCVLELGGSDAFVVMPSADLDAALTTAVKARTVNGGQSCIAAKRFFVAESVYEEFVRRFVEKMQSLKVGDPFDESTDMGPLATPSIRDGVHAGIRCAASLLPAGTPRDARDANDGLAHGVATGLTTRIVPGQTHG